MDGNGRWASNQKKSRKYGHEVGSQRVYEVFKICTKYDFDTATFFALSSENSQRPDEEVSYISSLLGLSIQKHLNDLIQNKIKFKVIGDISTLPDNTIEIVNNAEDLTKNFDKYKINIAYNYGGQWDILNTINRLLQNNISLSIDAINKNLSTGLDIPDIIVRTGGYKRLSNFMLWQAAYCELYFTDILWPDIKEENIISAIDYYKSIERKFGKV